MKVTPSRKYIPLMGDVYMNWVTLRDPHATTRFVMTPELKLPEGGHYAILRVQWTCNAFPELVKGNLLIVDRTPPRDEIHPNDLIILPIPPKMAKHKLRQDAEYYITRHTPVRPIGGEWKVVKVIPADNLEEMPHPV